MSEATLLLNLAHTRLAALRLARDLDTRELLDLAILDAEREVVRLTPPPGHLYHAPTMNEPDVPPDVCIFCRQHRSRADTICPSYPGPKTHHEFREAPKSPAAPPEKKRDAKLCTKCGLHPKNPAAATNGCEHDFPEASR